MKKFLTLVLALAMVLALAAPAMAFTTVEPSSASYEMDIYLVDYDSTFLSTASLPAADRGYAKNEIVCAVVEIVVPKGETIANDYDQLVFSGEGVSLKVTDNKIDGSTAELKTTLANGVFKYDTSADDLYIEKAAVTGADLTDFPSTASAKKTTKFMFFAKVTGDDASLKAKLDASAGKFVDGELDVKIGDDVYTVVHTGSSFFVFDGAKALFEITVTSKDKTEDLYIYNLGTGYLAVDPEAGIFYDGSARVTDKGLIRTLQSTYEDFFVDAFGFDFSITGGLLKESFFTDLNGATDVVVTVDIEPWTAYVTVPDAIVVDPPKTGDAASIVGFVMIVLAGAAAIVAKKVRA